MAFSDADPANPPREVMLQWNDGTWEHRAYWGANLINNGNDGTVSRRNMGPLPAAGQWVRLEVPASAVGLEGSTLRGMAFSLFDGSATWDAAGKSSPGGPNDPAGSPTLTVSIARSAGGQIQLSWPSVTGKTYRVMCKSELADTNWVELGSVTAAGASASFMDSSSGPTGHRFYMVSRPN